MNDHDPLLERLAALPPGDLAPGLEERQRARLRRAFAEHAAMRPAASRLLRMYLEVLEPAGLAGATAAYLLWALGAASVAYR